ncbi:MAG: aminomethyl-transferring glycine dehydrogenase subunit GcvPA [Desulfopila sp.]|jgi:glycine dehydrogenase subunit 1|nr:aminomethyl-transferring glycine dehydrogenase subunit GcvPA [Desulfopila sp.]
MRYLPHTEEDIQTMMARIGVKNFEELFPTVPRDCRHDEAMALPPPHTEWEIDAHMEELRSMMSMGAQGNVLVGAGSYHHNIPSIIPSLTSRSEFLTAYTPYQPEMAQGTLQGVFEYQTLTARLLGVDVANASMYDGASALAEGLLMALRLSRKKKKVAVSRAVHPHYRDVVATYFRPTEFEVVELPFQEDGRTDLSSLSDISDLAAVALQSPNFFGVLEDLQAAATVIHAQEALLVAGFTEPLAFGLFKNPGSQGADIVCGEGQSFGIARSFGGPGLGMFGCKEQFVRNMPGRLVGETVDLEGKRGFVLTLATREQHIRREKATSNICSNQGINTITATMYMAALGGSGIAKLARLNYDKAAYMKERLAEAGATLFAAPGFNEFVVEFSGDFSGAHKALLQENIFAGLELGRYYPELQGRYLFCVTETTPRAVIDRIVEEVKK